MLGGFRLGYVGLDWAM